MRRKHLARPSTGSACKRLAMYARWMTRPGPVDLGLWAGVRPDQLVVPLDVHTGRQARRLGLLARPSDDWRAVQELTAACRALDPDDPARYDFAPVRARRLRGTGDRGVGGGAVLGRGGVSSGRSRRSTTHSPPGCAVTSWCPGGGLPSLRGEGVPSSPAPPASGHGEPCPYGCPGGRGGRGAGDRRSPLRPERGGTFPAPPRPRGPIPHPPSPIPHPPSPRAQRAYTSPPTPR